MEKAEELESDGCANCDWFFCTITKWLLKGLEDMEVTGRVETIQWSANTDVTNSNGVNNDYINNLEHEG